MEQHQQYIEIIQENQLFQDLNREALQEILAYAQTRTAEEDSFFFLEGNPATHLYILLDGSVKLTQVTPNGQQVILEVANPQQEFAVLALLEEIDYPVSAQAVEDSKALAWDKESLDVLMKKHPQIAINALYTVVHHTTEFQHQVRDLSTQRVARRIARTLTRLASRTGKKTEDGVLIDMPLTRQDIAEMTGTTLYTVSRVLKKWEEKGLIKSKRAQITITYPHGLVVIAEDLPT